MQDVVQLEPGIGGVTSVRIDHEDVPDSAALPDLEVRRWEARRRLRHQGVPATHEPYVVDVDVRVDPRPAAVDENSPIPAFDPDILEIHVGDRVRDALGVARLD